MNESTVDVKESIDTAALQRLIDKEAIRSNLYKYARGVDRRDYDAFRDSYWPDAYDDHGTYKGDVDGLMDWLIRRHDVIEQAQHIFAQIHIDFLSDDVAVSEVYVIGPQRYSNAAEETIRGWVGDVPLADDQRLEIVMYARMIDRVEKRNGEWKVARREVVIEQTHTRIITLDQVPSSTSQLVRGPQDAIYRFLREEH